MIQKAIIVSFILITSVCVNAQDIGYARKLIDTLCSPDMYGRGYVNGGMAKAAVFLSNEMNDIGLKKKSKDYLQAFPISVNTFPGQITLRVNDSSLLPGMHYVVAPYSPPVEGIYHLVYPDTALLLKYGSKWNVADSMDVVVFPEIGKNKALKALSDSLRKRNIFGGAGIIRLKEKLHWYVSGSHPVRNYFMFDALDSLWKNKPDSAYIVIRSVDEPYFQVENVFGYIQGLKEPDSFILFTAHYDHLGMMGNHALYPGAHDNASGTALIMDIARYYHEIPPAYSIGFLACAAEESGLHGSSYFAEHPLIPLDKIRMVVNLDLVGSGSKGIHVVNGKTHPREFDVLKNLNDSLELLTGISSGGASANSDHYPFYARGVPAFFIFTKGDEYREYHTLSDRAEMLPLTAYDDLFKLLTSFSDRLMMHGK